jgi:hypothetical protein
MVNLQGIPSRSPNISLKKTVIKPCLPIFFLHFTPMAVGALDSAALEGRTPPTMQAQRANQVHL